MSVLAAYRRHLADCPHRAKGAAYTLCDCPIWCYGYVGDRLIRQSLRTADWARAQNSMLILEHGDTPITLPDRQRVTVAMAVERFLADLGRRELKPQSIEVYRVSLGHMMTAIGHSIPIAFVTLERLERMHYGRTVAASTRRKEIERVRSFFAFCLDHRWIKDNPAMRLRAPRVESLVTQPYTRAQVAALLAAAGDLGTDDPGELAYVRSRARAILLVMLYSGLRVGDVAQLKRSAIDKSGYLALVTQKTHTPVRVQLPKQVADELRALPRTGKSPYLFWSGRGDLATVRKNIWRTCQRVGKLAGVACHPHRFRDTFAVELLSGGADIRSVQLLLGHASVRTTERHYAHFVAAHQRLLDQATARLDYTVEAGGPVLVHAPGSRSKSRQSGGG